MPRGQMMVIIKLFENISMTKVTIISDVNECAIGTDNCHADATCTNKPGTFTCACNSGFSGNGVTCSGK